MVAAAAWGAGRGCAVATGPGHSVGDLAPENVPGLGEDPGLAKKGRELGAAWEEGGEGGEPCPSVPSVPGAHPAGKPWGHSCLAGPAQNSLPSGQGCLGPAAPAPEIGLGPEARGQRAAAGGREGPPSSGTRRDAGTWGSAGTRGGAQAGIPGADVPVGQGRVAGRRRRDQGRWGRARIPDAGPGEVGQGRGRRAQTGEGAGIPARGPASGEGADPAAAGWGADLTACGEARRGPAAPMEGRRNARRAAARAERPCGPSPCTQRLKEGLPWARTWGPAGGGEQRRGSAGGGVREGEGRQGRSPGTPPTRVCALLPPGLRNARLAVRCSPGVR